MGCLLPPLCLSTFKMSNKSVISATRAFVAARQRELNNGVFVILSGLAQSSSKSEFLEILSHFPTDSTLLERIFLFRHCQCPFWGLYLHAVRFSNGVQRWIVPPRNCYYSAEGIYPASYLKNTHHGWNGFTNSLQCFTFKKCFITTADSF